MEKKRFRTIVLLKFCILFQDPTIPRACPSNIQVLAMSDLSSLLSGRDAERTKQGRDIGLVSRRRCSNEAIGPSYSCFKNPILRPKRQQIPCQCQGLSSQKHEPFYISMWLHPYSSPSILCKLKYTPAVRSNILSKLIFARCV